MPVAKKTKNRICHLYTSDAADERSSVDLGGRRIIKKKKHQKVGDSRLSTTYKTNDTRTKRHKRK